LYDFFSFFKLYLFYNDYETSSTTLLIMLVGTDVCVRMFFVRLGTTLVLTTIYEYPRYRNTSIRPNL